MFTKSRLQVEGRSQAEWRESSPINGWNYTTSLGPAAITIQRLRVPNSRNHPLSADPPPARRRFVMQFEIMAEQYGQDTSTKVWPSLNQLWNSEKGLPIVSKVVTYLQLVIWTDPSSSVGSFRRYTSSAILPDYFTSEPARNRQKLKELADNVEKLFKKKTVLTCSEATGNQMKTSNFINNIAEADNQRNNRLSIPKILQWALNQAVKLETVKHERTSSVTRPTPMLIWPLIPIIKGERHLFWYRWTFY